MEPGTVEAPDAAEQRSRPIVRRHRPNLLPCTRRGHRSDAAEALWVWSIHRYAAHGDGDLAASIAEIASCLLRGRDEAAEAMLSADFIRAVLGDTRRP